MIIIDRGQLKICGSLRLSGSLKLLHSQAFNQLTVTQSE